MTKVRVQVDFSERRVAELEHLQKLCDLGTKKELFNNALTLFEWAVGEVMQGRSIASLDEKTQKYRELQMPALETAARHSEQEAYQYQAAAG